MAKDTDKLIRQLSLIAYLMAERHPVTASEIRRDVEGYSDMNEDAFARRFYADRAELEALGIKLTVEKPSDGVGEQENYTLDRDNFFLAAIDFTDSERAALQTALTLLDGEFAYAEPLRLALQQITWGRPSPLDSPAQRSVALALTASTGGADISARLAKVDTAIYRRKRIEFEYYTMQTGTTEQRQVDPYHLFYESGQFYLVGYSRERDAVRVFRLSRIRGKVGYATKSEHDFQRPDDFNPREYANRISWQLGTGLGTAEIQISDRIAWFVERHFSTYGELEQSNEEDLEHKEGRTFRTDYAVPRLLVSWVLGFGEHAQISNPPELVDEASARIRKIIELHSEDLPVVVPTAKQRAEAKQLQEETREHEESRQKTRSDVGVRPERFARLVTLALILIQAGRKGERLELTALCDQLKLSEQELREDINVLNVVNFGGGTYVIYAEILRSNEIEVDLEPYSDTFDRPARLLPIEAKALVAAIDLIGSHLPMGTLDSAREKIVTALGQDPVDEGLQITSAGADDPELAQVIAGAIADRHVLELEYYAPNEDRFSTRTVEPYGLINSREGWYVASWDRDRDDTRHFRLDRIKNVQVLDEVYKPREDLNPVADIEGWPSTGEVEGSRTALVWISPDQARWASEEQTTVAEFADGSIIVEWTFKGDQYLVKEILKEAGDAAVLEPADVREKIRVTAKQLLEKMPETMVMG